jgi:hypothetical protein
MSETGDRELVERIRSEHFPLQEPPHAREWIAAVLDASGISQLNERIRVLERLVVAMDDHVHDCCGCFGTADEEMLAQMDEIRARTAIGEVQP